MSENSLPVEMSWSEIKAEYDKRDMLFENLLKVLSRAGQFALLPEVTERMDKWHGCKVKRFNEYCENLIKRYSKV